MPLVYRVMRKDQDGFPTLADNSLGARAGFDFQVDGNGMVILDGGGMSVAPGWRDINISRIPKRLREQAPGARGSNQTYCYRFGEGEFGPRLFAEGLWLAPDSPIHGNVTPAEAMPSGEFQARLAATRSGWREDES